MDTKTGLEFRIIEMAGRIRELREIVGLSCAEMAAKTGVTVEDYIKCEAGETDLNFAFIYRCALALSVNVTDIIEGTSPKLARYTLTRKGEGQLIDEAHGMTYFNLASSFKNRISEPLYVISKYNESAQNADIELTSHEGQELDIVVSGALKVQVGDHVEILHAGDTIYYDSSTPHGMIAVEGNDCIFYAIVLNTSGENISAITHGGTRDLETTRSGKAKIKVSRVYDKFIDAEEDENGTLVSIKFKDEDKFNFAYDVVDRLADEKPEKTALIHVSRDLEEKIFTFRDLKKLSAKAANYFKAIGIRRGDKVMLMLKRRYQFWISVLALHKMGAIAIPAVDQLKEHDLSYRFNAAGVKAVICTADGIIAEEIEKAAEHSPTLTEKFIVSGTREGWHDFDAEFEAYSDVFERSEGSPCGEDPMLMYFTSGTTGNPKIATHCYKYPLGHFITAKYWHGVNPDGVHFTVSDTGWAKAAWGKIYGQWLCEAAIFVYDFDRFDASVLLPMIAKHKITTFCAPPTILRMMVKQDLSKYDLSSIENLTTAGEALNPEVFRQFEAATGHQIMEGFGQTETTVVLANMRGTKIRLGSMGKPVPLYDVKLLDSDGNPVATGETGEICISVKDGAPCGLFRGYYRDEAQTYECWHDGYYHTGDTAWMDEDGYFWYVGRVDDVIKSSGYRIGPFEIENVLMELPYVLECGVCAAPDTLRGQVVRACIVLTQGTEGTDALKKEIQEYVKGRTAPYKYPRIVEFHESLPKTVSGKIVRSKL